MELFVLALLRIPTHLLFLSSVYQISEGHQLKHSGNGKWLWFCWLIAQFHAWMLQWYVAVCCSSAVKSALRLRTVSVWTQLNAWVFLSLSPHRRALSAPSVYTDRCLCLCVCVREWVRFGFDCSWNMFTAPQALKGHSGLIQLCLCVWSISPMFDN